MAYDLFLAVAAADLANGAVLAEDIVELVGALKTPLRGDVGAPTDLVGQVADVQHTSDRLFTIGHGAEVRFTSGASRTLRLP